MTSPVGAPVLTHAVLEQGTSATASSPHLKGLSAPTRCRAEVPPRSGDALCSPTPRKKGTPVPCEDRGSLHTLLEGASPLVKAPLGRTSGLPRTPTCFRRRTPRSP